jgi:phosphoribosylformimino-5-aminoimidazole carboxamide ribotide isomerase
MSAITRALDAGAARVVLGTAALKDPDLLMAACAAHGDHVVVGLDARDGMVAIRAWVETSDVTAGALAARVIAAGCTRLIYTDIATDGMLSGPNLPALRSLLATVEVPVIASGGVANEQDLHQLAATGVEAAIAGKALYAGTLPLSVLADWN